MPGLIISFLVLFIGLSGIILTLSGMLNSYQKKKLEYIAYKNQGKARHILESTEAPSGIASELEYYKSHDLITDPVIDINFISRDFGSSLFKTKTYINFAKSSFSKTIIFFENLDLALIATQSRILLNKTLKVIKVKYNKLANFLLTITEPIENKDSAPEHSSVRSAMATSSRIKSLNQTFQNITDKGQEFVKNRFSKNKTKLDVWPNLSEEIEMNQKYDKNIRSFDSNSTTTTTPTSVSLANNQDDLSSDEVVYQELEEQILEKLHQNLNDFELWESLGDFYTQHNEFDKAKEVYGYINQHSKNNNQLARLQIKI